MSLSKTNKALLEAYNKGYRVNKNGNVIGLKGIEISPKIKNGYKKFCTRLESGGRYIVNYHRLQAYQKFGDKIFEEGIVVRHLNGNSLDNSLDNIAIGTQSDNMFDRSKESLKEHSLIATRKRQDKFRTYKERCLIYEDLRNNIPYSEIMKTYNIPSKGTLSYMKNKSLEYKEYMEMLAQ